MATEQCLTEEKKSKKRLNFPRTVNLYIIARTCYSLGCLTFFLADCGSLSKLFPVAKLKFVPPFYPEMQ